MCVCLVYVHVRACESVCVMCVSLCVSDVYTCMSDMYVCVCVWCGVFSCVCRMCPYVCVVYV